MFRDNSFHMFDQHNVSLRCIFGSHPGGSTKQREVISPVLLDRRDTFETLPIYSFF